VPDIVEDEMVFTDRFGYEWRKHSSYQNRDASATGWLAVDCGDDRPRSLTDVISTRGFISYDAGTPFLKMRYTAVEPDRG